MISSIIEVLDLVAAARLSASARHGLCELVPIESGTAPAKYTGGDSWQVVSVDAGGDWSYWRLTERIREARDERMASCDTIITATHSLRLVTLISRDVCDSAVDTARAAASDMRKASRTVRDATGAMTAEISVSGIDGDSARVYAAEFKGAGGSIPAGKMLVAIDLVVAITGREECFGDCGSPIDATCAVIAGASDAKVIECLGERINEICDNAPCPTECEVIEGMDASEIVACVPSGNRPALLCEVMDTAEATPEAIVVCLDGASKTDAVKAIICDPCPECDPMDITVNGVAYAEVADPCGATTNVRVLDADDNPVGSLDAPDWRIPSVTVLRDGAPYSTELPGATVDVPSDCAPCADATYQLKDSAANNIGAPGSIASGASANITAPDGTVTINNSVPTLLHTVNVRSNASAVQAIADSTITKPDATTVGLPATVALDVRDYRSGIAYQFGMILHYGNPTSYRTGDEGDMYANGFFDYTRPVYPTNYAELVNNTTLVSNNVHGNTNRFTDRSGGQTYSDDIVQDHFQGVEIYRVLQAAATWNSAIDGAVALSIGGDTDWRVTPMRVLLTVMNGAAGAAANFLNFAPFSISNSNYWTSTTQAFTTTSALRIAGGQSATSAKTNTNAWLACRRFI